MLETCLELSLISRDGPLLSCEQDTSRQAGRQAWYWEEWPVAGSLHLETTTRQRELTGPAMGF